MFPTNIRSSTAANQAFQGTASNDWLLYATSNQSVWIGTTGTKTNYLQITPTCTMTNDFYASRISVGGGRSNGTHGTTSPLLTTFSNIQVTGIGSFSNLSSSNLSIGTLASSRFTVGSGSSKFDPIAVVAQITGSNVTASNLNVTGTSTFSNLSCSGAVSCSNIYNRGRLLIYN